jgi:hypothetical protein
MLSWMVSLRPIQDRRSSCWLPTVCLLLAVPGWQQLRDQVWSGLEAK